MEIHQLRYVVAIADHGSFTRAAESLHTVQPALSQAVRRLENELGSPIFTRTARGVRLTPEGETFVHHVRRGLADIDRAARAVEELRDLQRGRVTLGLPPSATIAILPPLLEAYRTDYPGVQVEVVEEMTDALVDQLTAGRLDLALVSLPVEAEGIAVEPLYDERLALAVSRSHRLVGAPMVDLGALVDETWILPYRRHGVRRLVEEACATVGFEPRIAIELTGLGPIKELVRRGLGVSVLPPAVVAPEESLGLIATVPIVNPVLIRTTGVARRSGHDLTPAAARLHASIRQVTADREGHSRDEGEPTRGSLDEGRIG